MVYCESCTADWLECDVCKQKGCSDCVEFDSDLGVNLCTLESCEEEAEKQFDEEKAMNPFGCIECGRHIEANEPCGGSEQDGYICSDCCMKAETDMKFDNLKIVKTINNAVGLSEEEKEDVLKRIRRIYESEDEKRRCGFVDSVEIGCVFVWGETKDGCKYWSNISYKMKGRQLDEEIRKSAGKIREFPTGSTRDTDENKLNYIKALSPIVMKKYVEYLGKHRQLSDGSVRDWDNWKQGIDKQTYLESQDRHHRAVWMLHRGYSVEDNHGSVTLEDSLCGVIFNAMGYLYEVLKKKE